MREMIFLAFSIFINNAFTFTFFPIFPLFFDIMKFQPIYCAAVFHAFFILFYKNNAYVSMALLAAIPLLGYLKCRQKSNFYHRPQKVAFNAHQFFNLESLCVECECID